MLEPATDAQTFPRESFLALENLHRADLAVFEVFAEMLGLAVDVSTAPIDCRSVGGDLTAIVGYSGAMRGCCELKMDRPAIMALASTMLAGLPIDDNDSLDDAIGEICNMIGGGWKDRVPGLSSQCSLSPPTVILGTDYQIHMSGHSITVSRWYRFKDHRFLLTLRREDTSPGDF